MIEKADLQRAFLLRQYLLFHAVAFSFLMAAGGCRTARGPVSMAPEPVSPAAGTSPTDAGDAAASDHEHVARTDPLEFLRVCRQHYLDQFRDYRCEFHIRERGEAPDQRQLIAIKFRESPYSVDMTWLENSRGAKRIAYVEDRWVKEDKQLALVVPDGLAKLVAPGGIKLDIHGKEFRASSSRSVDQFGFRKTLERAIRLCESAQNDPAFDLRYVGRDQFEGRSHIVLERRLPYSLGGGPYPDRLAVIYIDEKSLTPTAIWSYADEEKNTLLGEFINSKVEFNVGFTDADFE